MRPLLRYSFHPLTSKERRQGPKPSVERTVIFFMVEIKVDPNKPFEAALRQFKKKVELSGITGEMRKREHYEKPSVRRKLKSLAARKHARRKARAY